MNELKDAIKRNTPTNLFQRLLLALIFLAGFGIRIYDLTDPPLDFHPTRQLRSAILARSFYYQMDAGADPALRELAVRMGNSLEVYEPPILEGLAALTYMALGQETLPAARVLNAFFWVLGGLALYCLARRFIGFYSMAAALAFYFFLPFSIIASRSFQPDPWMVMWILIATLLFVRWLEKPIWTRLIMAGLAAGLAVLVKLMAVFPLAGIFALSLLSDRGFKKSLRSPHVWALLALSAGPSLVYYIMNNSTRSAGFFSFWTASLSHLVLESNFYADWLAMLGGLFNLTNILLAALAAVMAARGLKPILIGFWVGYFVYGLFLPYQMTTHEYYHLELVPLVALGLGVIADAVFTRMSAQHWFWRAAAASVIAVASFYSLYVGRSIMFAASYANEPVAWKRVGEAIPEGASITALTSEYGNRLMYYGWRGISAYWPNSSDLKLFSMAGNEDMDIVSYFRETTDGRDFFLVTLFSEYEAQPELKTLLTQNYPIYSEGDGYILFDLRHPLGN